MEKTFSTIQEVLAFFGVTNSTLTPDEKRSLDEDGYVIFSDFIPADLLQGMRDVFEELMDCEGADAGKEFRQEVGARRLANLVNKDPVFDVCYTHPKMLAVLQKLTGEHDGREASLPVQLKSPL